MSVFLSPQFTYRESRWAQFKAIKASKSLNIQYEDQDTKYLIWGYDGPEVHCCLIYKGTVPVEVIAAGYSEVQNGLDLTDFETNYMPTANSFLVERDTNGATYSRIKIVPTGWSYCAIGVNLSTSNIGSLEIFKNGVDDTAINKTYKIYNSLGTEITDNADKASAVKTVITIEPTFNIYVISGRISQTTNKILLDVVAVPDIPAVAGGSKQFSQNLNLKKFNNLTTDGKAPKYLSYNATYHTSKFKFTFYHDAGTEEDISVILEVYKE